MYDGLIITIGLYNVHGHTTYPLLCFSDSKPNYPTNHMSSTTKEKVRQLDPGLLVETEVQETSVPVTMLVQHASLPKAYCKKPYNLSEPVTFTGADADNFLREIAEQPPVSPERLSHALSIVIMNTSRLTANEIAF